MEAENIEKTPVKNTKTTIRTARFAIVGFILTIINYALYTVLANIILDNNNLLWLSILISTTITTFLAYLLHSKITWKERLPSKNSIYNFFIWNLIIALIISPLLTQLFSYLTSLYEFTHSISLSLHLPFSLEFIQSTGAFCLTTIIIMTLNFIFYDKFVFKKESKNEKC
ncbi:MAG: GtrA family protein [Candidatus Saccharibacteria bacterium]|nr:GtrA family protein [Candidatus Saccharibacteria bacterium]